MTQDGALSNPFGDPLDATGEVLQKPVQTGIVIGIERVWREKGLDETLAETFPCSDPLSSIPNPRDLGMS